MNKLIKWLLLITLIFAPVLNPRHTHALNPPSTVEKVAIIGGGMSGIAAATFLKDSNVQVYVFEKESNLGGHAQTATIDNGYGEKVEVDLGPQYFSKGPWDLYIDFLKYFHLYNKNEMSSFSGELTTCNSGSTPYFVVPTLNMRKLGFNFHLDKLCTLYSFYVFNKKAYHLYRRGNSEAFAITVGEWLNQLNLKQKDKENLLLPFLGSLIGVSKEKAKQLSIFALTKLFAFSGPLKNKKFHIMHRGMAHYIRTLGERIEGGNISILTSAHVEGVKRVGEKYAVTYLQHGRKKNVLVDKLITAVHPFQLFRFLQKSAEDHHLFTHLSNLEYVRNRIVLHNSDLFQKGRLSSFVDVDINENGSCFMTMQMGKIHRRYGRIKKSWVNDKKIYQELKNRNAILSESTFYHPFVSPTFLKTCQSIERILEGDKYTNFAIVGGWTQVMETQATAILSAYKATCRLFPDVMEEKKWRERLPSLKKIVS